LVTSIETVHNFCDFCKALMAQRLWNGNFTEFGDNGLLGCSEVVYFYSPKWGHLGVLEARLSVLLIGWWDWTNSELLTYAFDERLNFQRWLVVVF